jgi:hypothetical protein
VSSPGSFQTKVLIKILTSLALTHIVLCKVVNLICLLFYVFVTVQVPGEV